MRQLYCPADEPLSFTFRAHSFQLQPNATQAVSSPWKDVEADTIFEYVLKFFEKVGVREVYGDARDEAIKAEAERVHTDWLCDVAGVERPKAVPPEVAAARAGLVRRGVVSE